MDIIKDIITYIGYSFILGLSGAMMPGPVLAVTITETLKRGFMAAVLIVCGHSVLELVTVALLALGVGAALNNFIAAGIIGVVGGGVLLWMTIGMLKEVRAGYLDLVAVGLFAISIHVILLERDSFDTLRVVFLTLGLIGAAIGGVMLWITMGRKKISNVQEEAQNFASESRRGMSPFNLGIVVSLSNPYWTFWWLTIGLKLVSDAVTGGAPIISAVYFGHILSDFAWYCTVGAFVVLGRQILTTGAYRWMLAICAAFLLRFGPYFIYSGIARFLLSP